MCHAWCILGLRALRACVIILIYMHDACKGRGREKLELINNSSRTLGDDLKKEIKAGSKLRIAATCFSIYAYAALKEELERIDELKFLFTTPVDITEKISDNVKKEKKEFFIPKLSEMGICGTEFEIKLKNRMTQKAVARECADWVRRKVKIKALKGELSSQTLIDVERDDDEVSYAPIGGFTAADLGYEQNNRINTMIAKVSKSDGSEAYRNMFDMNWQDEAKLDDITNEVAEYLSSCYKENAPEFIYFLIIYNIFRDFLQDLDEDYMPNEATGFKNSLVWNKLYNFQKDGAIGIINKLEKYNGCILADSVGLGKTFTALAVMQYYSLRNKSILVLCPKRLEQNWAQYRGNTTTNIFYKDKLNFDILFHTDLGRTKGYSCGINLATVNWGNYDLVVIDESHNFRNNNSARRDKDTRYDFLMKRIMQDGVKTKVLMLSATPVNNRYNDLKNQLLLAYSGDMAEMGDKLGLTKSVQVIFNNAQKAFNRGSKLPTERRHAKDLLDDLDIDFSIILDSVTIARSRKHIRKYYNTEDIGKFPDRLPAKSYSPKLTNSQDIMNYKQIYDKLLATTMSVYAPLEMLKASRRARYEKEYEIDLSREDERANTLGQGFDRQLYRETGLKKLMMIGLMKRLESSVYAFRKTVKAVIDKNKAALEAIDAYEKGDKERTIQKRVMSFAVDNFDDDDSFDLVQTTEAKVIPIRIDDLDRVTWKRLLQDDVKLLQEVFNDMQKVSLDKDAKLNALKELIDEKMHSPINKGNKKILVFSASEDTAQYLYDALAPYMKIRYGIYSAMICGGGRNKTNIGGSTHSDRLLAMFSPRSKQMELTLPGEQGTIDLLIGTDCISEGQNLQDCDICINYDIHWNPVRIVQRFGRIDRIGSSNDKIQLVNFWPDISLDEYINLNARVTARMAIVNATATADDNIIDDQENDVIDYRKEQLIKLQEGTLQELEDVDGNISITDLGLNDFVMDLAAYRKQHGDPKGVITGLHAVVAADESKGIVPGVIFVLRNRNGKVNIDKQNRLHPYYMVYVDNRGDVVDNHLEVKPILDVLRTTSKGVSEPLTALCNVFNKATKDGLKMDRYNELLDCAVESIVSKEEEKDMLALFKQGSKALNARAIDGVDDFELIAFVVIEAAA